MHIPDQRVRARVFRCLLAAFADSGKGVVIMTNSDNATNLIVEIVHSIAAEYGFPPE